jgi:predicted permease
VFMTDLHHAWRRLQRAPGYAVAMLVMLAAGLAVSVAMFSVLKGVVLASLPYPGGERVVNLTMANPAKDIAAGQLTSAEAFGLVEQPALEAMGFYGWGGATSLAGEQPREMTINVVTEGFFPALGVAPLHGRWFNAEDYATGRDVVVLSFVEWQRLLGGVADPVGRKVDLDGTQSEVVGVMPAAFRYPSEDTGLWRPALTRNFQPGTPQFRYARYIFAVARLAPGTTPADLERAGTAARTAQGLPDEGWRLRATPLIDEMVGEVRPVLWACFGIALLVLVLACGNAAVLLDARLAARRHELAVAQALGASPARLRMGILAELAILVVGALVVGTVLAQFAVQAFAALAADTLARADEVRLDGAVFLFASAVTVLVPLLIAALGGRTEARPAEAIRSGGRGTLGVRDSHLRRVLPTLGIALSTVALVAAVALSLSLMRLAAVDPGFRTSDLHALQMFRGGGPKVWTQFATAMQAELTAIPGVEAVAVTTAAPLSTIGSFSTDLKKPGAPEPEPYDAGVRRVSAGYLNLLGIPVLRGRGISADDRADTERVVLINETVARRSFAGQDPVGQVLQLPFGNGQRVDYRIVGVVADQRNGGLRAEPQPELLVAFEQYPWVGMTFLVRSKQSPLLVAEQMRQAMWRVEPTEAVTRQFTLSEEVAAELAPTRFFVLTLGAFAALAVLLAGFGVYSIASYAQRRRVPEFGLRLALGAAPRRLMGLVLRDSAPLALLGLLAGLVGAALALRVLASQLYGFEGAPWAAYGLGALAMLIAVGAALAVPAWRAGAVEPITALRDE